MMVPLEELANLVGHRLGPDNHHLFEDGLYKTSLALGIPPSEVARRALARDRIAYRELVSSVTVHETYFFRHPQDFEVAAAYAAQAQAKGEPWKTAWSVGCSTGEEAYSIAVALLPFAPELTVLGTDISVESLEVARLGRYGSWSFRDRAPNTIPGLIPSTGGQWEVNPRLRSGVVFNEANLAQDPVTPPAPLPKKVNVIFCRNVLLYFTPELAQRIFTLLSEAVTEGGLLILGPLEGPAQPPTGFVRVEGSQVLRRVTELPAPKAERRIVDVGPPGGVERRVAPANRPSRRISLALVEARRLADRGDLDAALERASKAQGDPDAMYLAASIHFERGELMRARELLQRILMSRPDFVPAYLHLALVAVRRGDSAAVEMNRRALGQLLAGRPDDEEVGVEGMKVAYVRAVMESLARPGQVEK